jgi:arginase
MLLAPWTSRFRDRTGMEQGPAVVAAAIGGAADEVDVTLGGPAADAIAAVAAAVAAEERRPLALLGECTLAPAMAGALQRRYDDLALVWLDAHGDLNTPETSPSGNLWGMPLRMILDSGAVDPQDTILLGARSLDSPEREYVASIGLRTDAAELEEALDGTEGVYVALDVDSLEPGPIHPFMPEPGGLSMQELADLLRRVRGRTSVLGAGFSGLAAEPANVEPLTGLALALGL